MIPRSLLLAALLAGCSVQPDAPGGRSEPEPAPEAAPRACPPLPQLRAGATSAERRRHTQTIVDMYADCAGGAP